MPRAGRELEQLVERIEGLLAGTGVEIQSPDYILDKNSGTKREVDISLRRRVGSADVLVIIECRDRSATQDVLWIEQLASKKAGVGASVAIAVSSSGLTEGARNAARAYGVEVRRVDELSTETVLPWLMPLEIELELRRAELKHVGFSVLIKREEAEKVAPVLQPLMDRPMSAKLRSVMLTHKTTGETCSVETAWQAVINSLPQVFDGLEPDGARRNLTITANYVNEAERYQLVTEAGPVEIDQIVFQGEQWVETAAARVTSMTQYADGDGEPFARAAQVVAQPSDVAYRFEFYEVRDQNFVGFRMLEVPEQ
jgi:Restriction endonuclease